MSAQIDPTNSRDGLASADSLCTGAEAALETGAFGPAVEGFLRAMDADPSSARAWGGIGVGCFRQGLRKSARIFFEMAVRLDPADEDSVLNWAESTGRELTNEQARSFLEQAGVGATLVGKAIEVRGG
ncbi:MAG TPA: tetratricopeptide repeat protein [Fibrobacteria bacterium]|nr:tetratricopeptide repeat protein [Fibrobacteria bacterium]